MCPTQKVQIFVTFVPLDRVEGVPLHLEPAAKDGGSAPLHFRRDLDLEEPQPVHS